MLFTTFEFGIAKLGENTAQRMHPITGSSVMAQKKNPDALELVRATAPQVTGYAQIVGNILSGLPFAYNRDSREVKEYIQAGFSKTHAMLECLIQILATVTFDEKKSHALVLKNYSLTTDLADFISQKTRIGYRSVYKIIGEIVAEAIQEQKLITQIGAEEINKKAKTYGIRLKITDEDIGHALDITNIMKRFSTAANTKLYKKSKNIIHGFSSWSQEKKKHIHSAHTKTHVIASSL
jgi:argininosuccinate lyase